MVIWSGKGFLVAVVVFLSSLGMEFLTESLTGDSEYYQTSAWPLPAALLTAAVLTAAAAFLWIPELERSQHTLFFIPIAWWPLILAAIAAGVFIYRVAARDADPLLPAPAPP
jgi:hypothetical protein